ncbi:Pectate_lyase_3 domain-containing protein [Rhodovastum atsumiense]|uniref:Rhamnogalacturonase A/B/Epimerase-like pectate lyase domain-containing protein n=1 Tax=Rhodovastum atsumiense TaxID=504468 RepID=A0A5M6J054_9PROT|nr:glycosyl hydrolase family 28-related protein [Rhodovastum atsumiense]KAA5613467.1 hypothetical protein F1189_05265 [Rhodovastum atsumiense]CAH2603204.1 Pectate_lyase_3 domain-containing protein [Rhodovastum atsumiense]
MRRLILAVPLALLPAAAGAGEITTSLDQLTIHGANSTGEVPNLTVDGTSLRTTTERAATAAPAAALSAEQARAQAAEAAAVQRAANLGDLADTAAARANLGLGGAARLNVGTSAGTVAAGDDSRITGAATASALASEKTRAQAAETAASNAAAAAQAKANAALPATGGTLTGTISGGALSGTDAGAAAVTATGATAARTMAARAADVVNVKDFGARCDGSTDDAAAIQSAIMALRARTYSNAGIGVSARLVFPGGACVVRSTLDLTNLSTFGTLIDGAGTTLFGATAGAPVINALGMQNVTVRDLSVYGSSLSTPTIGIQIGLSGNGKPADSNRFDNIHVTGSFSLAAFYNYSSEVTSFAHVYFHNTYAGNNCYAFIEDGTNHFGVSPSMPADGVNSFNENLVENSWVSASGGCTPLWISGSGRHRWISSYISNFSGSGYGAVLWTGGTGNRQLDMDVHFETSPSDTFLISGPDPTPTLIGFRYRDHINQATNSIFKLDTNITSASLVGGSLEIGQFLNPGVVVFADSARWSSNQDVYLPGSNYWNLSKNFNGTLRIGGTTYFSGTLSNASLPSPLVASQIISTGSVTGVTVQSSNKGGYKLSPPSVTIAPPPDGGSQATAYVSKVSIYGATPTIVSGGSGYTGADITLASPNCTTQPAFHVVQSGGVVTQLTGSGTGLCSPAVMQETATPTTGGGGTGLVVNLTSVLWGVNGVTVGGAGGGYSVPPAVTFSAGAPTAVGTATLGASFTAASSAGQVLLNSNGTVLGVAGSSGAPVLSVGALIDNSGVRQSLGSSYTVPANTSLVRFTQSSTVAASTVTLPAPLADGQSIQFVNYAGAITALTFSPAVNGWTNGTTLAAYTGLRIRWDATAGSWYRE